MTRLVPAAGPMILLGYGVSRGLDLDALCGLIGFAPHQITDPLRMVPFDTSLALWRALIERLPHENVGVGIGTFARLEHYGVFWEFIKHVRDGRELLDGFVRFSPFGDTSVVDDPITLVQVGNVLELRWPAGLKYGIPERVEGLNVALLAMLSGIGGRPFTPCRVRSRDRADAKRRMAEQHYGCDVTWDSPDDALCFDDAALSAPFPNARPEVAKAFIDLIERKLVPDARLPFAERLRRVVELQTQRGDASQRSVARALGLSVRTLQRELQHEGLRYGDVFGEALKRIATSLMLDSARSLHDIALELGYSEPSSFARTWRRLTGESPARYRSRLLQVPTHTSADERQAVG